MGDADVGCMYQLPFNSSFRASDRECLSTSSTTCGILMVSNWRFISLPSLNLTASVAGALLVRGNIVDSIFMPSARALGGMSDRKRRAGLERGLKGLKVTRTSVRNLVIIAGGRVWVYVYVWEVCFAL